MKTAAELPVGSQIHYRGRTIEYHSDLTIGLRWRDEYGNAYTQAEVDVLLADGGHIVFIPTGRYTRGEG